MCVVRHVCTPSHWPVGHMSLFNPTLEHQGESCNPNPNPQCNCTVKNITLFDKKKKKKFLFIAQPIFAKCVSLPSTCFIELCEVTLEPVPLRKQDKVSFALNV